MTTKNDLSKEQKMENVINRIIRDEIYSCQSGLVEMLLGKCYDDADIINAGYCMENIKNYFIKNPDTLNRIEELTDLLERTPEDFDDYELIKNELEELENEENEPQEIFEWWLISNWLAEKLEAENEPILETDFGIYWGRTTTGQAISIDYVINKIAEKIVG